MLAQTTACIPPKVTCGELVPAPAIDCPSGGGFGKGLTVSNAQLMTGVGSATALAARSPNTISAAAARPLVRLRLLHAHVVAHAVLGDVAAREGQRVRRVIDVQAADQGDVVGQVDDAINVEVAVD